MKLNRFMTEIAALSMAMSMSNCYDRPRHRERPDTSNVGGGYAHDGMYSHQKKLRKGAGHKKLTRAQRKQMKGKLKSL